MLRLRKAIVLACITIPLPTASGLHAQSTQGGEPWGVRVAVQGWQLTPPPNTGQNAATFHVTNIGSDSSEFAFSCSSTGGVSCDSVTASSEVLPAGQTINVSAWYSVSDSGGRISLTAVEAHGATDVAEYDVSPATVLQMSGGLSPSGPAAALQGGGCGEECGPTYGVDVMDYAGVTKPANSGPYTVYWGILNTGSSF